MSPCAHVAPVTLTPAVMTDLVKMWSTTGLNAVHVETWCTECGTAIRINFVKRGEQTGKVFAHVEAFP